jgi:DNA-binding CsgD family transcriptional regulator
MPSQLLRAPECRAIARLSHECRDLGDDNGMWQLHFLEGIAQLISAEMSVGGELRDFAAGMPAATTPGGTTKEWGFENGLNQRGWQRALELLEQNPTYSVSMSKYIVRFRQQPALAVRGSDLVPRAEWERSVEYDEVYRTIGVYHNLACFHPIPGRADEVYGSYLCRAVGRRDFSPREALIVQTAFATIAPMIGSALARIAEPSPSALAPRVCDVLQCVLEGDSDKQIARRLGISGYTVNQYTKVLYRHFGVQSRTELLARWVRRGWGKAFTRSV